VAIFSQDFYSFRGFPSETHAAKIVKILNLAMKTGIPVIGLNDSGGARIQEGVNSLGGYADIFLFKYSCFRCNTPNISYSGTLCRRCCLFTCYYRFLSSWYVIQVICLLQDLMWLKLLLHEDVLIEDLGGAETHASKSGVAHFCL